MTDNEIIKALKSEVKSAEYVDSFYCNGVDLTLIKSAVALINRQKAEIERLKNENEILSKNADNAFQDGLNEAQDLYAEQVKAEIKSEAIKEFAEKLKKRFYLCAGRCVVNVYHIDKLVKEMEDEE